MRLVESVVDNQSVEKSYIGEWTESTWNPITGCTKIGSIGKTGIYPKNARTAIIPANLLKFTVSKKVNFNYVFYYLNSRGLQNRIKKISTATAQPAFNLTKFRKLRIPLPPSPNNKLSYLK